MRSSHRISFFTAFSLRCARWVRSFHPEWSMYGSFPTRLQRKIRNYRRFRGSTRHDDFKMLATKAKSLYYQDTLRPRKARAVVPHAIENNVCTHASTCAPRREFVYKCVRVSVSIMYARVHAFVDERRYLHSLHWRELVFARTYVRVLPRWDTRNWYEIDRTGSLADVSMLRRYINQRLRGEGVPCVFSCYNSPKWLFESCFENGVNRDGHASRWELANNATNDCKWTEMPNKRSARCSNNSSYHSEELLCVFTFHIEPISADDYNTSCHHFNLRCIIARGLRWLEDQEREGSEKDAKSGVRDLSPINLRKTKSQRSESGWYLKCKWVYLAGDI